MRKNVTDIPVEKNLIWDYSEKSDIYIPIGTKVKYRCGGRFWRDSREYEDIGVIELIHHDTIPVVKNFRVIGDKDRYSYIIRSEHDNKIDIMLIGIIEIL